MAVLVGAISGVLLAACFFCQMLSLGYAVPVAGALLLSGRPSQRRPWPALIALTCVLGVCLAVWNLRPKDAYTGLFLPRAGIDLAIAVGTDDGTYKPQRDVPANLVGHAFESRFLAEREMHAALTPIEADRHHRAGAVRVPQEQGTVVLGRVWQKFKLFARGYEVPTELDPVYFVGRVVPVGIAPSFSLLLGLAVLGLWASRHAAPGFVVLLSGLLLVVLAMNLIGFVSWRYRLPAVIPCCLLAAHGLGMIGRACRRSIRVGAFVSLLAICAYGAVKPGEALMRRAENRLRANLRAASQHAGDIRALSGVRSPRDRVVGLARAHLHTAAFQAWLALPPGERNFDTDRIALRYLLWLGAYDAAASIVRALPPEVRDIAIYDGSAARGYVLVSLLGLGSPG